MCGIVALLLAEENAHANQDLFDSLTALQHRGQDAAGIMTCDVQRRRLYMHKDVCGLSRTECTCWMLLKFLTFLGLAVVPLPTR
ncbi:unnamed protein product [Choristocarpus tenellus]